jgi:hypothetical protein
MVHRVFCTFLLPLEISHDKALHNFCFLATIIKVISTRTNIRGSFQKFCKLYVFSLKMNLFYKIHLQTSNVISIVLYHSSPTFGQVLCSCLDAFVVDVSDYSGHLLNASEAFPTEWFLQLGSAHQTFDFFPKLKTRLRGKRFRSIEEVSNEVT